MPLSPLGALSIILTTMLVNSDYSVLDQKQINYTLVVQGKNKKKLDNRLCKHEPNRLQSPLLVDSMMHAQICTSI